MKISKPPLVLRLRRRALRQVLVVRAFRRRRALTRVCKKTRRIKPRDILVFVTLRNERVRLPYFLEYYRQLGVAHFLVIDNDSHDGSREYLCAQPDVSLWTTKASYKRARFGMDWINYLLMRYGSGHWCLTVDPDEFFVYPHCDLRPLRALTDWLDSSGAKSFPGMLLDMYPEGAIDEQVYQEGEDPLRIACWFDSGNYMISRNKFFRNLWIQGGPRARQFFADDPASAPALNKIPLVKWHWRYAYVSSTHMLLPCGLNQIYENDGGEQASGCLLHMKFLSTFTEKSKEELERGQHYANSKEYKSYHQGLARGLSLWSPHSERYRDWRQLEELGIISRGNWA